ncbi:MAG: flagellar hook assembly protein FlgD [Rhodospirillales bacterium]
MFISGATGTETTDGTKSSNSAASLQEDLNRFLNLLTTQLKNQDPLDPMDSNEFTSQLVQFASVEQQIYQNSNLEKLVGLGQNNQVSSLVGFIDRQIEVQGTKFPLENSQGEFTYTMPAGAKSASIVIRDANGLTVYEQDANLDQGQHTFEWDGRDRNGNTAPDGAYSVLVSGLDHQGELLDIPTTVFGRVTGIGVEGSETTMFMGDIEVPQSLVLSVKEAASASEQN